LARPTAAWALHFHLLRHAYFRHRRGRSQAPTKGSIVLDGKDLTGRRPEEFATEGDRAHIPERASLSRSLDQGDAGAQLPLAIEFHCNNTPLSDTRCYRRNERVLSRQACLVCAHNARRTPSADARAVLERALDHPAGPAEIGREADIGQNVLRSLVRPRATSVPHPPRN
jgi:hypothetical protein